MVTSNRLKRIMLIFVLALVSTTRLLATIELTINVKGDNNEYLTKSQIEILKNDSVIAFAIVERPYNTVRVADSGKYKLTVSHIGYISEEKELAVNKDTTIDFSLKEQNIELDEVVVKGKKMHKTTPGGEVFTLSNKAKNCKNPFRALSEIPLLNVDISAQSVTLRSGEEPLVLVDGKLVNSGIAPIDPSRIDSVEISEVVSTRYLQMGVTKILNIHLKKQSRLYTYEEYRTRHDIPLREGLGGLNFEIGNSKLAIAGSLFANYLYKNRTRYDVTEHNNGISKAYNGDVFDKSNEVKGYFLLKWIPSSSDYFSVYFTGSNKNNFVNGKYQGFMDSLNYLKTNDEKANNGGMLGALFHEHTFKDKSKLTTFAHYNYGFYSTHQSAIEEDEISKDSSFVAFNSKRNQVAATIDFETEPKANGQFTTGYSIEYTSDNNVNQLMMPKNIIKVKLLNSFNHFGYAKQWKNIYFMASLGLQYLSVETDDNHSTTWCPKASSCLSWKLVSNQQFRLGYYLTNSLPTSVQLSNVNLSTNPWLQVVGNPYLKPVEKQQLNLTYDIEFGNFYLRFSANHNRFSKMIESFIENKGEYQIQSYRNNGTYRGDNCGSTISYTSNSFLGSISANYYWDHYNGQQTKKSVGINANMRWNFGNFFLYSVISWKSYDYTATSLIEHKSPINAHIQIAWQISETWYASVGLPYFWGRRKDVTKIEQLNYYRMQQNTYASASLRPWILVSWTLRKNAKKAIARKMPNL